MPDEKSSTGNAPSVYLSDELDRRLVQQTLVAEFGRFALRSTTLDAILAEACRVAAAGLETPLAKVLEPLNGGESFLVRAGCGWKQGVVGHATIGGDLESPAGFAFKTGEPVISNHLAEEKRFRTPQLMADHGVQRAINVLIRGDSEPLGVLEADSRDPGAFSPDEVHFLQALANTLGNAIEKERSRAQIESLNADLEQALKDKDLLTREVDHRVKNSLTMIGSMLAMQARQTGSEEVKEVLEQATTRVMTIARIHDQLYRSSTVATVEFGTYLENLCEDIGASLARPDATLRVLTDQFELPVKLAVPLGLCTAEMITNALKYALRQEGPSQVSVRCRKEPSEIVLSVTDDGPGLPEGFDPATSKGLGMRLVRSFTRQLDGALEASNVDEGACFVVRVPLVGHSSEPGSH